MVGGGALRRWLYGCRIDRVRERYTSANTDSYTNGNSFADADRDANSNSNGNRSDSDGNGHSHCNCDSDNRYTNSHSCTNASCSNCLKRDQCDCQQLHRKLDQRWQCDWLPSGCGEEQFFYQLRSRDTKTWMLATRLAETLPA